MKLPRRLAICARLFESLYAPQTSPPPLPRPVLDMPITVPVASSTAQNEPGLTGTTSLYSPLNCPSSSAHALDQRLATEAWDAKADEWDAWTGTDGDANRRFNSDPVLWRMLGDVAGRVVLDAGCGAGYLSVALARAGAHVLAIDVAPRMVAITVGPPSLYERAAVSPSRGTPSNE